MNIHLLDIPTGWQEMREARRQREEQAIKEQEATLKELRQALNAKRQAVAQLENDVYSKEEMLKLERESILAAESETKAIKSLVEDGIKIELDNLKKLIDVYKDSLSGAKSLYDYQKKTQEQTQNILKLERQLQAYSGAESVRLSEKTL